MKSRSASTASCPQHSRTLSLATTGRSASSRFQQHDVSRARPVGESRVLDAAEERKPSGVWIGEHRDAAALRREIEQQHGRRRVDRESGREDTRRLAGSGPLARSPVRS